MRIYISCLLLLFVCFGCEQAKKIGEETAKGLAVVAQAFLAPIELPPELIYKGPYHERVKWKAEDYFTNPDLIAFCHALERRDIVEMDRLLQNGLDINAIGKKNVDGEIFEKTLLIWALPMGEDIFVWMLQHGADPWYRRPKTSQYVMFSAAEMVASLDTRGICLNQWHDVNFEHYLKRILDIGPPPPPGELDRMLSETVTTLYGGGGTNTPQRVQWLLDAGADVNAEVDGVPLLLRTCGPSFATQLVLLNAGADWQRISPKNQQDYVLNIAEERVSSVNVHFWDKVAEADAAREKRLSRNKNYQEICRWLTQRGARIDLAVEQLKLWRAFKMSEVLARERNVKPGVGPLSMADSFEKENLSKGQKKTTKLQVMHPTWYSRDQRTWLPPLEPDKK